MHLDSALMSGYNSLKQGRVLLILLLERITMRINFQLLRLTHT